MSNYCGMCVGGPCDGQMVASLTPYHRVQLSMPAEYLYDERVYMHNRPIGPTSVDYEYVPGIRFPSHGDMNFFLLKSQIRECRDKGMNPVFWAFNHIAQDYSNTRVDTL
jgi:hypothetical protein